MDISINSRPTTIMDPATLQGAPQVEAAKEKSRPALVITEARTDAISGADVIEDVPEAALRRDDALGQLLSAVFNMPAPPMPAFPS